MTLQIDTLAYTNRLRQVPPGDKLVFAIALLLLSNVAARGVQCLIALWLALWIVGYARIPAAAYGKLLAIPLGFWGSSLPGLVIGSVGIDQMSAVQSDIGTDSRGTDLRGMGSRGAASSGEIMCSTSVGKGSNKRWMWVCGRSLQPRVSILFS